MVSSKDRSKSYRIRKTKKLGQIEFNKREAQRKKEKRRFYRQLFKDVVIPCEKTYVVLKHPFTMLINGPSGSGKSEFVRNLLYNRYLMFDTDFDSIEWNYGVAQKTHNEIKDMVPDIKFSEGLPDDKELSKNTKPKLLILDDLMKETQGDIVGSIFTKRSHHNNMSVIYLVQNLFANQGKGKGEQRDISLNTKYMVLFKNPRDGMQPQILGSQMGKPKFIAEAYKKATLKPHGYLFLDFTQNGDDKLRVRTLIFPQDEKNIIFTER